MVDYDSPCIECEFFKTIKDGDSSFEDCRQGMPEGVFGGEYGCYRFSPLKEYRTKGDWKWVKQK